MTSFFFDNWSGPLRVLLVGTLAYAALVLLLRISGKRTLAKMNAFDLVVTVALGSTLATIILSSDVALVEGVVALALLVGLQFVITWLSARSKTVRHLVKNEPSLLLYQGRSLPAALKRERVTEEEVLAAIRAQGITSLEDVEAVVLETDGTFSCLRRSDDVRPTALRYVNGARSTADVEAEGQEATAEPGAESGVSRRYGSR